MEWSDIRIFLALTRTGTFGAAARSLGVSHPTVARRLQTLEASLGQKLFQKNTDGLTLTPEGTSVLALAESMEETALTMERRLAGQTKDFDGTLRVAASDWFGTWLLPQVTRRYTQAHPRVSIELLTATRLYSLSYREADLAFRVVPFTEPDIIQRRLMTLSFGIYASAGTSVDQDSDGTGLQIIEDMPTGERYEAGWLKQRLPNARSVFCSNSRNVQAKMCAEGIGLAVLPRVIGDRMEELKRIEISATPPTRDLWIGYHSDLKRMHRLRAFVDAAIAVLAVNDE